MQGGRDVTVAQLLREVNLPAWGFSTNMVDLGYVQYPVPNNLLMNPVKMNFVDDDRGIVAKYLWSWAQEITPSAILGGSGDSKVDTLRESVGRGSSYFVPYDFKTSFSLDAKNSLLAGSDSPVRTLVVVKYAPSTAQFLTALANEDVDAAVGGTGVGGIVSDVLSRVGINGIPTEIHIFPRVVPTSIIPAKLDRGISQFREFSVDLMRIPNLVQAGTSESDLAAQAKSQSISATVAALETWGAAEASIEAALSTINAVVNTRRGIASVFQAMKRS
jgi:hypothetical protein